jgi:L-threonylcarbamoyladenylate synthase
MTEILKINPNRPSHILIKKAAKIIKDGGLVVLPTDTVYGLACDATNPSAVAKVFYIKKRPLSQPLSIAIGDYSYIYKYVGNLTDLAEKLAKKFLPGPLTLILNKSEIIPDIVTAGRDDIGIRIPDSKIVLMLVKILKKPIVIPSANIHNRPSPTTALEAINGLYGKVDPAPNQVANSQLLIATSKERCGVDLILDGGKTRYGVESTIVSCLSNKVKILREGAISAKQIFASVKK